MKLKSFLKRSPLIYSINGWIKARQTSVALARWNRQYSRWAQERGIAYSEAAALDQVRTRLGQRGIARQTTLHRNLRIFWVGANWNQDNSGILAALDRWGKVTYFRNVNGDYGPLYAQENGSAGPYDPNIVKRNDACLLDQVRTELQRGPVDVLLGQMWAHLFSAEALRQVQQMGVITANIAMDDRLPVHWGSHHGIRLGSVGLCGGVDLVLTSSPECCLYYAVEGCPAIFWPMASDPDRFKPYPEDQKKYDVSFIGNKYGLRGRIVDQLLKAGIPVAAFGTGWPNGSADADRSAEIFGRSRIILGVGNVAYNDDVFTLKLRDFDATMAGALYITHRNPDLLRLFEEGKEIDCYLSIEECIRKIRFHLDHPDTRMIMARMAAARSRREHTWDHRLSAAFGAIGFWPRQPQRVAGGE